MIPPTLSFFWCIWLAPFFFVLLFSPLTASFYFSLFHHIYVRLRKLIIINLDPVEPTTITSHLVVVFWAFSRLIYLIYIQFYCTTFFFSLSLSFSIGSRNHKWNHHCYVDVDRFGAIQILTYSSWWTSISMIWCVPTVYWRGGARFLTRPTNRSIIQL